MENEQIARGKRPLTDTGIQVISRAFAILRALRNHPTGLTLSQIAREVDLARSTVHRIITTLEAEQVVVSASAEGGYLLGPALARLGAAVNHNLKDQIRPFLDDLFLQINETIDLAIFEHDQLIFVDQISAPHRLSAVSGVGVTFPLHCTANGKAMLSKLDEANLNKLLPNQLPAFSPNTITDRQELFEELEQIKRTGIAFDREEHTEGICAIGVSFWDPMGTLAAISIPVPSIRFNRKEETLIQALQECYEKIEVYLGH